ncbi:hypothetical protein ASD65_02630 [Microbacterium sp. Root61]|uniref:hypothetical protein n=1 Tax=Microbacterium sp. Root61 TaxID=1736570 RepID=UPI0006F7B2BD|nr:hypothetical protein [Microbacterium sp. Root61]KRA23432.1 hypothetical protein ASD65_02630 [Microbacterium sp. Root61]
MTTPSFVLVDAAKAASVARVRIESLSTMAELKQADAVLREIWRDDSAQAGPMPIAVMRALEHAGSYVHGAFDADDGRMLGASIGFFSTPEQRSLHSHITGVLASAHRGGIGYALKLHQREWCIARGAREMTWTFDPLVARNAYFNIVKLGADIAEYLDDFYGQMDDQINRDDPTDRVLARWRFDVPARTLRALPPYRRLLTSGADGAPVPVSDETRGAAIIEVPVDIEGLRLINPAVAADWRAEVRAAFARADVEGLVVDGFVRGVGYTLAPHSPSRPTKDGSP